MKIVNLFTGRINSRRRWRSGIHEAVEAREGLEPRIQEFESIVRASITYPGLVTMFFNNWAAMSGTLLVVQNEFWETYAKCTMNIPINVPSKLIFLPNKLFETKTEKFIKVLTTVEQLYRTRRPLLLASRTILETDIIGELLNINLTPFQRVDCLTPSIEEIAEVRQVGMLGVITIGTNVLGRGINVAVTEESLEVGGLYVIGVERYTSNRVDLQLAGRAGRNGQAGSCRFLMSLEDPLFILATTDSDKKKLETCISPTKKTKQLELIMQNLQSRSEGLDYITRKQDEQFRMLILTHYDILRNTRRLMLEYTTSEKELKDMNDRWAKYPKATEELTKNCRIQATTKGRNAVPLTLRALTEIDSYH